MLVSRCWLAVTKSLEKTGACLGIKRSKEIIEFTRERIAHYKRPKHVEFGDLPKTATGKIQKFKLREREWAGKGMRIQG